MSQPKDAPISTDREDDFDLPESDGREDDVESNDDRDGDDSEGGNARARNNGEGDSNGASRGGSRPRGGRRGGSDRGRGRDEFDPKGDERAANALEFLREVMDGMGMDCTVHLRRPKEDAEILLEITGEDAGRVIGKKGHVLTSMQFLTNRVVNRPGLEKRHVLVDVEGYRHRRENQLASMAVRLSDQAVEDGKIITFEPMNPRDRRVVHLALAKVEGVITRSDGEGDQRRVQIIPVRR
jgi:spoIIIJ-associated protein